MISLNDRMVAMGLLKKIQELRDDPDLKAKEARCEEVARTLIYDEPGSSLKDWKSLRRLLLPLRSLFRDAGDLSAMLELSKEPGAENLFDEEIAISTKIVERQLRRFEAQRLFTGEADHCGAFVEIRSHHDQVEERANFSEPFEWADMLLHMYLRWAEYNWHVAGADVEQADILGIRLARIHVKGENVYGLLKGEQGYHSLARVSPLDPSGQRHHSAAWVEVLPDLDDEVEFELGEDQVKVEAVNLRGPGGQHQTRSEMGARATHLPTGFSILCRSERSQHKNRSMALGLLKGKLFRSQEENREIQSSNDLDWAVNQVRSYVVDPYKRVFDLRTGWDSSDVDAVLGGDLNDFLYAYLRLKTGD